MPVPTDHPRTVTPERLHQARQQFCYGPLPSLGLLIFEGPDAARFLQNQTTQDIATLSLGDSAQAAAVDRQGKIQGVFTVGRLDEQAFWLILDKTQIPGLVPHFEKFHIIEKFDIHDVSETFSVFAVLGAGAKAFFESLDIMPATSIARLNVLGTDCIVLQDEYIGQPGFLVLVPNSALEAVTEQLSGRGAQENGVALTADLAESLRIEAGSPQFGVDFDRDTLLPETGLAQETVSYTKGCYLGQEVIARVKTYGSLQKTLAGLVFGPDASVPPRDTTCWVDGEAIGTIKSALFSPTLDCPIAMAYLDKSHRVPGKRFEISFGEHATSRSPVEVVLLPFYTDRTEPSEAALLNPKKVLEGALGLFSEGKDGEAIDALHRLITLRPEFADAYEALGVILGRNDRVDEAIAMMHRLLAVDPDHVLAHTNLSIFHLKKGDKEKAEEEKAKATIAGMRKKAKESGFDFGKLEAERKQREQEKIRQLEDRIALFIDALKYKPDDPLGNFGLGSAYLELQRYEEAIPPLERTLQAQPKHSVAYLSLGKALEATHNPVRAKITYEKGIEVAAARGDMMPLQEMQQRLQKLSQ